MTTQRGSLNGAPVRTGARRSSFRVLTGVAALALALAQPSALDAQSPTPAPPAAPAQNQNQTAAGVPLSGDYVIGPEDMLDVTFRPDEDQVSRQVLVRPDGKISLVLLNDIQAAGLTPEKLAAAITRASATFYAPTKTVTVIVTEIHSRKVYIIGEVAKPGTITLGSEMTVLQALGEAGGFLEGANKGDVTIVRNDAGGERRLKFNYNDVLRGKNIGQNIKLLPGDTILVR
jgi:polysaccharide export outer membrane protein